MGNGFSERHSKSCFLLKLFGEIGARTIEIKVIQGLSDRVRGLPSPRDDDSFDFSTAIKRAATAYGKGGQT